MFCCRHTMQMLQHNQTIKKELHEKHLSSQQVNTNSNDVSDIIWQWLLSNIVNATGSISTISSSSNSNKTKLVALSSFTVDTQAINYLFYLFNHFDSQPNQLYFFLNMLHPLHGGAHGIVWHALNCTNNYAYNVSTLEGTHF